jgi:hypothetical protein
MRRLPYQLANIQYAPFLPMRIGSRFSRKLLPITFNIDTGAEITVIPMRYTSLLSLDPRRELAIDDYNRRSTDHVSFVVDLYLGTQVFRSVEVISSAAGDALWGLDILNQLKLTLDGPKKSLILH